MKMARLALAAIAVLVATPIVSAHADCTTPEGRATMQAKYRQALAAWSMSDAKAYEEAQEQLQKDNYAAQHSAADKREQKQCAVWQKYIKLSRK
jgi:ABC-type transport system involved in cytochrome bd biosynthesis fused ATPase/permease subunit